MKAKVTAETNAQGDVRTRHDEWSTRVLSLWLKVLGDVQIDARIAGQSRRGDVFYTERRPSPSGRSRLGVLGELARGRVLFEIFRNPPARLELLSCLAKVIELTMRDARAARRVKEPLSSVEGPSLCVITPSMSGEFAVAAGATRMPAQTPGLYTLSAILQTVVVVVNELPQDPATVWLRLLGRGSVQKAAVEELAAMSKPERLRDGTLELLVAWQQSLPKGMEPSEDDAELKMNLERIYERWEHKIKTQGISQGKAEMLLAVLEGRGLRVTAAQRALVLACTESAVLDAWARAAGTTPDVETLLEGVARRRPRSKTSARARR